MTGVSIRTVDNPPLSINQINILLRTICPRSPVHLIIQWTRLLGHTVARQYLKDSQHYLHVEKDREHVNFKDGDTQFRGVLSRGGVDQ